MTPYTLWTSEGMKFQPLPLACRKTRSCSEARGFYCTAHGDIDNWYSRRYSWRRCHRSRPKRTLLSNMPVAVGIASFRPQVSSTFPGPTHTKYSIEVLGSQYLDDNACLFFSRLVRSQDSADVRIVYLTISITVTVLRLSAELTMPPPPPPPPSRNVIISMCVRFIFLFVEIEISDGREAWRIAMKTFAIAIAREMGDVAEEAGAQDDFLRGHWHTVGEQRVRCSLA